MGIGMHVNQLNPIKIKKLIFFICALTMVKCAKIELGPPITAFVDICISDNGNSGNGSDVEVNLEGQLNIEHVSEYRFFMMKRSAQSSITLAEAESLSPDNYHIFFPSDVIKIRGTVLPASFRDVDGDIITADEFYATGILTISNDEEVESNSLFISENSFQLSSNNLISTFFKAFNDMSNAAAGSLAVFQNELAMSSYNIQGEPARSDAFYSSPIHVIKPSAGITELGNYSGLLGGNAFDSKGNLYQSVLSRNEVLIISPNGEIEVIDILPSGLRQPDGIFINELDEVFIIGRQSSTIQKIDQFGSMSHYASITRPNAKGITGDENGNLYVSHNVEDGFITQIDADGSESLLAQLPTHIPSDYVLDYFMWLGYLQYQNGFLYVAGMSTDRIYKVSVENGEVQNWAGSGVRGLARGDIKKANLNRPNGLQFSSDKTKLFISGTTDVTPIHVQYSTPPIIWEIDLVEQ